jgi:hypothetical protein
VVALVADWQVVALVVEGMVVVALVVVALVVVVMLVVAGMQRHFEAPRR